MRIPFDYALLLLESVRGNADPRLKLDFIPLSTEIGNQIENVHIGGYPGDRNQAVNGLIGTGKYPLPKITHEYWDVGPIEFNDLFIKYTLATTFGQSGTPIVAQGEDRPIIIGIHTGCEGNPKTKLPKFNYGIRVKIMTHYLNLWTKDFNY